MVEFRTRPPGGGEAASSSGTLEKHIDRVIENVKNDPELKAELASNLQNSDVNPLVLKAIFPDLDVDQLRQSAEQTQDQHQEIPQQPAQDEIQTVTEKPTPEQLIGLVNEMIDLAPDGEQTEIGKMREWAVDNKDVLETAIQMKL